MALKGAVRYCPTVNSSLETTIAGLDASVDPPTGTIVMTAQLVAYDDTKVGVAGNPYVPGDPNTEKFIFVVYQTPISLELSAFDGLTLSQSAALWSAALASFKASIPAQAALTMFNAAYSAQTAPPSIY